METRPSMSLMAEDSSKHNLLTQENRTITKKRPFSKNNVHCTACGQEIDAYRLDMMRRHPLLDVLLCKSCYIVQTTKEFTIGEDGTHNQCRWCSNEGELILCDFCKNVFCKVCIVRNLGTVHLNIILNADEDQKWQCYVCDREPLAGLAARCTEIFQVAEEEYDSKPKKSLMSPDQDDAELSPPPAMPPKAKRGRKPGSTLPKRSLDMLKKEHEAASEAELDEIIGKMEDEETSEFIAGMDDPDFSLEEHLEGIEKPKSTPPPKDEIVYFKTNSGEIVALRASSTKESVGSSSSVPKRPKGRPRIHPPKDGSIPQHGQSASSNATVPGKKYPRSGSQYKNSMSSLVAMADVKLSSRPPDINQHNIWFVLEKLLASTQSMTMVLASLKEDLRRANTMSSGMGRNPELRKKKAEVSVKLWRAFLAYKKSFVDLEVSSKDGKSHQEMGEFYDDGTGDYDYYNEEDYEEGESGMAAAHGGEEEEDGDEEALSQQQSMEGLATEGQSGQPMNGSQMVIQADDGTMQETMQK